MRKGKSSAARPIENLYGPLALTLLVVLFYWKVIFGNSIFVFVDASRFFYPLWKWGSDVLKQGWIPLWNPDAQFGTPYFADPQMAYAYPPVPLLYSVLSPLHAFATLVILHHLWALLGFWVFARKEGFSSMASFLGSLIFGFSLHVVCSSWTPVALLTISWIPWVFFAVGKVWRGEKNGFLFLSLAWSMQLAAGYPVLVYLTVLAVGMHLVWRFTTIPPLSPFVKGGRNHNRDIPPFEKGLFGFVGTQGFFPVSAVGEGGISCWACLGKIGVAGIVALAYNLVWGLPFSELFKLSNYENGAGRFQDLGWLDFGTIVSPFDQGHPLLPGYHGPHYWVSTYFVGLPTLCLLIWGAFRFVYKKASWPVFFPLLALSLGVLGLGGLLRGFFPGYSLVIHSGYWLALLVFWIAWMAMESAESFAGKFLPLENRLLWAGIVTIVFLAALLVSSFSGTFFSPWVLGLSFLLSVIPAFSPQREVRWGVLTMALALSLGSAAHSINILLDKSYYETPPSTVAFLTKPGRLFFTPPLLKEAVVLQGDNMEQAYGAAKEKLYPNWPLEYGMEEAPVYNTLQLKSSFDWTFKAFQFSARHSRQVLNYLSVRYLFGKNNFADLKKVIPPGAFLPISENSAAFPKWYTVKEAVYCLNAGGEWMAEEGTMDYKTQCVIGDCSKVGRYQTRPVQAASCKPSEVEIKADGPGRALLVSSETAYPGWKLRVDGHERAVETVNHSFRGVVLNDGETQATFTFEPVTFRLGLFLALLVCALWAGLLLKPLFIRMSLE